MYRLFFSIASYIATIYTLGHLYHVQIVAGGAANVASGTQALLCSAVGTTRRAIVAWLRCWWRQYRQWYTHPSLEAWQNGLVIDKRWRPQKKPRP
jgi:hypothetical protein